MAFQVVNVLAGVTSVLAAMISRLYTELKTTAPIAEDKTQLTAR